MLSKSKRTATKTRPEPYSISSWAKKLVESNKLKILVVSMSCDLKV